MLEGGRVAPSPSLMAQPWLRQCRSTRLRPSRAIGLGPIRGHHRGNDGDLDDNQAAMTATCSLRPRPTSLSRTANAPGARQRAAVAVMAIREDLASLALPERLIADLREPDVSAHLVSLGASQAMKVGFSDTNALMGEGWRWLRRTRIDRSDIATDHREAQNETWRGWLHPAKRPSTDIPSPRIRFTTDSRPDLRSPGWALADALLTNRSLPISIVEIQPSSEVKAKSQRSSSVRMLGECNSGLRETPSRERCATSPRLQRTQRDLGRSGMNRR